MVFSGTDELKLAQSFPGMRLDVMVCGCGIEVCETVVKLQLKGDIQGLG
jgi:hypothetical protein